MTLKYRLQVQICRDLYPLKAHRTEGQCLLELQAPNSEKSLRLLGGTNYLTNSV
jgi:hypothetical protein